MKKRKFTHADSMAIQALYRRIKYVPTLQEIKTQCGCANVQDKGIVEFLKMEGYEFKK